MTVLPGAYPYEKVERAIREAGVHPADLYECLATGRTTFIVLRFYQTLEAGEHMDFDRLYALKATTQEEFDRIKEGILRLAKGMDEMMNVARLELSKELYELSGWEGEHCYQLIEILSPDTGHVLRKHTVNYAVSLSYVNEQNRKGCRITPLYDLGYLVHKFKGYGGVEVCYGDKGCIATSQLWSVEADTPEDAACLLTIELFKQGILKR